MGGVEGITLEVNGNIMIKGCEMIQVTTRCITSHLTTVCLLTTIHYESTLKV